MHLPGIKLYDGGRAPNPRRVRIFLAEKGISVTLVPVDIGKMEHKSEAMRARNPVMRVPVIELEDGTAISESVAICRYFEVLKPEPPLFGAGALEQARIEMWNRRAEFELYLPAQAAFRHLHPAMVAFEVPQVAEWGEVNKPRVLAAIRMIDAQLADNRFIAGEAFSMADISAFTTIDFLKVAKMAVPEDCIHLLRWHRECAARPSAGA